MKSWNWIEWFLFFMVLAFWTTITVYWIKVILS